MSALPSNLSQAVHQFCKEEMLSKDIQNKDKQESVENNSPPPIFGNCRKYANWFGAFGIALLVLIITIF